MGCTHYPLLKNVLSKVMGKGVLLIDSAREVAKEVRDALNARGLLNSTGGKDHKFFVSDEPARFVKMAKRFLHKDIRCGKKGR
jgi:glutamate racemase